MMVIIVRFILDEAPETFLPDWSVWDIRKHVIQ